MEEAERLAAGNPALLARIAAERKELKANNKNAFPAISGRYSLPDYLNRGIAKYKRGQLDDAIAEYTRAIEENPKDAISYNNRGIARSEKGDFVGAMADYNRTIELDPKGADAYNNRGASREQMEDFKAAFEDYSRQNPIWLPETSVLSLTEPTSVISKNTLMRLLLIVTKH